MSEISFSHIHVLQFVSFVSLLTSVYW